MSPAFFSLLPEGRVNWMNGSEGGVLHDPQLGYMSAKHPTCAIPAYPDSVTAMWCLISFVPSCLRVKSLKTRSLGISCGLRRFRGIVA